MILTFDKVNWFFNILRNFFASLDRLIFSLVGLIMQGIFNISELTANPDLANTIYERIYVLLGLFMVFKLTFSFLQYMISPDTMTDKERGVGKIIVRVVIMLSMIVILPTLFFEPIIKINADDGKTEERTILEAVQVGVIKTLPKIILGVDGGDNVKASSKENGDYMALQMLKAFYYPAVCNPSSEVYNEASCANTTDEIDSLSDLEYGVLDTDSSNTSYYKYQYMWPLTTIAGIALVVILLGFAVDIAIRVFKLLILQVIAPVPIMSYIDPKSSKDGAFSSWIKSFSSTYLDIFVKLGTLYILLLLFSKILKPSELFANYTDQGGIAKSVITVFLMIGVFKFAKDAPKFIKDALGMKDSGNGGLFGGLSTLGAAAGTIGGAAAGLVGGAAGGIAAAKAAKAAGNKGHSLLRAAGGALSGLGHGGIQGAKGAGKGNLIKGMSGAMAAQNAITQKKVAAAAGGSTWGGRMGVRFDELAGRDAPYETETEDSKNLNAAFKNLKTIRDTAESKGYLKRATAIGNVSYTDSTGTTSTASFAAGQHTQFKEAFEHAQRYGMDSFTANGVTYDMVSASSLYKNLNEAVADNYLNTYSVGDNDTIDAAFQEYRVNLDKVSTSSKSGLNIKTSASDVKDADVGDMRGRASTIAASVDPAKVRKYKANKDAIKKGK